MVMKSSDAAFSTATFTTWRRLNMPLGFMQRAAAAMGEIRCPVSGSISSGAETGSSWDPWSDAALED
jgi:hypothetical protein